MIKEIDQRDLESFYYAHDFVSNHSPHTPKVNPWTGNVRRLVNWLPAPQAPTLIEKGLAFLQANKNLLGFADDEFPIFYPDPEVVNGVNHSIVHYQQVYNGIPVFMASRSLIFNDKGEIEEIGGDSVNVTSATVLTPALSAIEALRPVVAYIAEHECQSECSLDVAGSPADIRMVVELGDSPDQRTLLDTGGFAGHVPARLVVFSFGRKTVVAWHYQLSRPGLSLHLSVVVRADTGEIVYCKQQGSAIEAQGIVYRFNPSIPKEKVSFPVKLGAVKNMFDAPIESLSDWVSAYSTIGENVIARCILSNLPLDCNQGEVPPNFEAANEPDQQILNIFYFCNHMHDFFQLLGFDRNAGAFEGNSRIIAEVYQESRSPTASFSFPPTSSSPMIRAGERQDTKRHAALDADVIYHEYTHGVTWMLVGGRINESALSEAQSIAMTEGLSDYFALTIQNFVSGSEKLVIGDWIAANARGIRSMPYDDAYANSFEDLIKLPDPHAQGEVWCAALMHWTRHLSAIIPRENAYFICWLSIVNALKIISPNPSYLDGRDAIRVSLTKLKEAGKITSETFEYALIQFWKSFATYGMGVDAISPGPNFIGIKGSTSIPASLTESG